MTCIIFFQNNVSNDSTDSNSGVNYFVTGSCGGIGLTGPVGTAGQLVPSTLSHHQRVGSFRGRLKKQHPICMADPPPIVVDTPSKSSVKKLTARRHPKPTMVVFGPSVSVDSASASGMTSSRVAVSVHMCDETPSREERSSTARALISFDSTERDPDLSPLQRRQKRHCHHDERRNTWSMSSESSEVTSTAHRKAVLWQQQNESSSEKSNYSSRGSKDQQFNNV